MIFTTYVPHSGPLGAKLLLVGEAPGQEEETQLAPFVGESGQILTQVLGRAGLTRDDVRLANLCNYRPYGNKFENLKGSQELAKGWAELRKYIVDYKPNVIGALGANPLLFLTEKRGINQWRGSILEGINGVKVIPTFHPAYVLRDRTQYPIFDQDIKRIVGDAEFPELRLPKRTHITDPRGVEREEWTIKLCNAEYLAVDIETVKNSTHILCVGFSPSPDLGVCFVNDKSAHYEQCVQRILSCPAKKVFQFGTSDTEQLAINGFTVENYFWDTMVAQHVMWPELPRGLGYLNSIYTREPYYKHYGKTLFPADLKSWSLKSVKQDLWVYNSKDCCVDLEIAFEQMKEMDANERRIFDFEMDEVRELIPHINRAGLPIDEERREIFRKACYAKWWKLQAMLEVLAGQNELNVKSTPKMAKLLYETLGFPVRRKRPKPGQSQGSVTCDEDAIVGLIGICADKIHTLKTESGKKDWQTKLFILKCIIGIREVRQLLSNYIKTTFSNDGRMRATYKCASTETGRWAAEGYVDGTGNNPQTWPREALEIPQEILDGVQMLIPNILITQSEVDDAELVAVNEVPDEVQD